MKNNVAVIILAAGKGERMKSARPKVLHEICGRPMLGYVLDLVKGLKFKQIVVALGHQQDEVRKMLEPRIKVVIQKRLLGTADAVKCAMPKLKNFKGAVLVLYADNPLLTKETIKKFLDAHVKNNCAVTLLTAQMDKPLGYGRILRDKYSSICAIVEEKDADEFQKDIKEINTGIVCFNKNELAANLKYIRPNNRKYEYYLTDIISILYRKGEVIENVRLSDIDEALGVNSRQDLAKANKIMQQRINAGFMRQGISIVDPDSAFISYGVKIGQESAIYPFTVIESGVKIGKRCLVGPFAHLRAGTRLNDDVLAGNFVEVVRSQLGRKTWVKHFCYLGDSRIGRSVNIGAGTVTANFDGKKKNITKILDRASIGSDTVLVAPVKVGKGAVTGAGAVVIKDVADRVIVAGVPAKPLKK